MAETMEGVEKESPKKIEVDIDEDAATLAGEYEL